MLQSISTRVATDFSMFPTVSRYSRLSHSLASILKLIEIFTAIQTNICWIVLEAVFETRELRALLSYCGMLGTIIFNNIPKIRYRMKRASSSTKENATRTGLNKLSTRKRPLEHHQSTLSSTQTFFTTNQTSINSSTPNDHPFYKTLGSNNFVECHRPESKQAYRRFCGRPQTSKGVRPVEKVPRKQYDVKGGAFYSQYVADRNEDGYRQESGSHIEIIVTNSKKKGEKNKGNKSKFQTDLDDEFLQLFAN